MTTIVPGKTYTHRNQWIRAPGGAVAVYIPVGYSGRLGKESIFKILSNDQHISCFLHFHDGAKPLARGWISKPFPLEDQQMVPVGPARTTNGAHSRRFEGVHMSRTRSRSVMRAGMGYPVRLPRVSRTLQRSRVSWEISWAG